MLVAIGQEMKQRLASVEKGALSRVLFGGLVIVLERKGKLWRLAIGRITTPPSATEAATVARDFGVPLGIEWTWTIKRNRKKQAVYQVAECRWIEREVTSEDRGSL